MLSYLREIYAVHHVGFFTEVRVEELVTKALGCMVQSAASQLLEQVDALLRCLPQVQPMSGHAMEGASFLTPDDYTPAR